MVRLRCPTCTKAIAVPESLAGKAGLCPYCKSKVRVPKIEEEEPLEEVPDDDPPVKTRPVKKKEDDDIIDASDWEEEDAPKRGRRDDSDDRITTRDRPRRGDDDDRDDRRRRSRDDDDYDRPRRRDDDDDYDRRRRDDYDDDDDRPRRKRRRKRRKSSSDPFGGLFTGMSPVMIGLIVVAGVSLVSCGLAILFPPFALVPVGLGALMSLVGGVMFLLVAFQDDVMQGLLCMFIPMYNLFYLITHFEEEKIPFFLQLGGTLLIILGYCAGGAGIAVWQGMR